MRTVRIKTISGKVYEYKIPTHYWKNRKWTDEMNNEFIKMFSNPQIPIKQIAEHFGITNLYVSVKGNQLGLKVDRSEYKKRKRHEDRPS